PDRHFCQCLLLACHHLPHERKNPTQWPGLVVWCLPLSAVAPIEDDYFLQVDSGGSNPVLMPPGE
ncbi:hypothetical protein, partial [Pseudomonas sp. FW305-3-2-15-E-TSA2]|uniref:hypothetical protein n=1 Tax=Pseudomonas sp. FW305-3-2-15-E-TSA2 TaxID=2751336 RepID=UPI001A91E6C4